MAEEYRFFLRTAVYVGIAGAVYWLVSYEPSGTVLLVALLLAIVAFLAVGVAFSGLGTVSQGGGPLAWLNRMIGFHERVDAAPPLQAGPELVPLSSAWPVVTAAAIVTIGLGLIFGSWLIVPGIALLVIGGLGWLTQLDHVA